MSVEVEQSTGKELIEIKSLNAIQVFSTEGGLDPLLERIKREVKSIVLDPSTPTGRDEIRSLAFKVKKSRTALFKMAKDLTEDWRVQTGKVNTERNRMEEILVGLEDEVRKPLTDFENKEKIRVATHEAAIGLMATLNRFEECIPAGEPSIEYVQKMIEAVPRHYDRNWEEFEARATRTKNEVLTSLGERLADMIKRAEEQAELKRLQDAEAKRLRDIEDQKIHDEAAADATRKANDAAEVERQRVAVETAIDLMWSEAQKDNEEFNRLAAEKREKEANERAEQERWDAIVSEAYADNRAVDAKAAAEKDAQEREERAAQKTRDELAATQRQEALDNAAREKNKKHKASVNSSIVKALMEFAPEVIPTKEAAKAIVIAIASNQIPNVRINY